MTPRSALLSAFALVGLACARSHSSAPGDRDAAGTEVVGVDGAAEDAAAAPDVPFIRPDAAPGSSTCGFDAPAFCETFEEGPSAGGRAGELDPSRWSVARNSLDPFPTVNGVAFKAKPARLGDCRPGVSGSVVLPDSDVLVCEPTAAIASRHLLTANGSQPYGVLSHRIRQPFDFEARTGTIKLDVDLSADSLCGFPAVLISADPTPAPSFGEWEHSSGPRNGIEIVFDHDNCHSGKTVSPTLRVFHDYVDTVIVAADNDPTTCARTASDALNHVEIYLTQSHVEVWASDVSPDGVAFPNLHRLIAGDVALSFSRGYVNLTNHNHATSKYWCGSGKSHSMGGRASAALIRWDNVGFDGPIVGGWSEASVANALVPVRGIEGCVVAGGGCRWRPDVIAESADEAAARCGDPTTQQCMFDGEARNVGYIVPRDGQPPLALKLEGVRASGAESARLALGGWYPAIAQPGPATLFALRYRMNGGPWHDRFINAAETNAFAASQGAGILNQIIDLDVRELRDGANTFEVVSLGVNSGYPIGIINVDLVLAGPP